MPSLPEQAPRLSLVVPTLQEAAGIEEFLGSLLEAADALGDVETIVVDDASSDGTAELARARLGDRGRVVVRSGPRGLSASVLEGWRQARGRVLGVMDADGSHPPALLGELLAAIEERGADVALASRYVPGGGTEGWPLRRRLTSALAARLGRTLVRVRDPMSGFLLFRREVIEGVDLDPIGWKIALEVLCRGRYDRVEEVPFVFRDRARGSSKLGARVVGETLRQCARLRAHLWARGVGRR
ncbi:MAG: polyprenol monophosphomannose synthase [Planctomycetota bacterium]|nr:MAG: polyprenol monophosphomannose synthase [Planctomycetota bacterium]